MITDAIISFFFTFMNWAVDSIPVNNVPQWMQDSDSMVVGALNGLSSLAVWFPIPLIVTVATALFVVYGIAFAVKLVRIVISLFTMGGGSAA